MNKLNITFSLAYLGDGSGTGGMVYNWQFAESWIRRANILKCDVRKRFFQLGIAGPVWLAQHGHILKKTDWLVQAASSGYHSKLIIEVSRGLFPNIKHLGIAHHPRWLENLDLERQEVLFYNSFDRILTISQHVKIELQSHGVNVPIDILLPGYTPCESVEAVVKHSNHIVWNGHLLERKGPLLLLEALISLDKNTPWSADFITPSRPDPDFYRKFSSRFNLLKTDENHPVQLLDKLPFDEFKTHLQEAMIFCLPSMVEGYSIATVEAISAGCIPVVPRTENFIELLGDRNFPGLYYPLDASGLSSCLNRILRDKSLQQECLSYVKKRLLELPDWEKFRANASEYLNKI